MDSLIAGLATRQHGVVAVRQLVALGVDRSAITRRVRGERLHRLHHGVYAVGHAGVSREGRWMAAVLRAGRNAALSHASAAERWGVLRQGARVIDVVTPLRSVRVHGVRSHASRSLTAADVTMVGGLRVTTPARTALDLGDWMIPEQLARVVHEFDFHRLLDRSEVERVRAANRGRRAATVLRDAVTLVDLGSRGLRSNLELRYLKALREARLPEPCVNTPIALTASTHELDFSWPALRVVLEVDGGGHARKRSRREDARRDADLTADGWTVVRATGRNVRRDVERVRSCLAAAVR